MMYVLSPISWLERLSFENLTMVMKNGFASPKLKWIWEWLIWLVVLIEEELKEKKWCVRKELVSMFIWFMVCIGCCYREKKNQAQAILIRGIDGSGKLGEQLQLDKSFLWREFDEFKWNMDRRWWTVIIIIPHIQELMLSNAGEIWKNKLYCCRIKTT